MAGGLVTVVLLSQVDNYQVEVLLTLALAMGGYVAADALGVSAPIAIVVAGLFVGSRGRAKVMSDTTREHLDTFWELIDEVMNAVLFLLVGLEVLVIQFHVVYLLAGSLMIVVVLIARWISVAGCIGVTRIWRQREKGRITVLTWGGLRGGLSIAMALSLPEGTPRNILLVCSYCVVVFCIFAQGLSVERVIRKVCVTSIPSARIVALAPPGGILPAGCASIYRHVNALNAAGISAYIGHGEAGFRCTWFENQTIVAHPPEIWPPHASDILLIPEVMAWEVTRLTPGIRKVIFNQNPYETFLGRGSELEPAPYLHPDVLATIVVSEDSRAYLRYAFPAHAVHRIRNSIDPTLFRFEPAKKSQIAYMERKKRTDVRLAAGAAAVRRAHLRALMS